MTGLRERFARLSLRARLTALLATMLLIACAAVGVATTVTLRSFLLGRLDQQLTLAGSRYSTALEHSDGDADNPETSTVGQSEGTLGARTVHGAVTAAGVVPSGNSAVPVTDADKAVIAELTPSSSYRTIELPTLGKYRVSVVAGRDGDVLITGLPQHGVDETLHHVVLADAIVFAAVLLIIGVLGALAVRASLLPLRRVASTAMRVSELPLASGDPTLNERVPSADERTEVGQVAHAVNHMLEQIEAAFAERQRSEERLRQFVADASHELRTPLAVVRSHAELIEAEVRDLPAPVANSLERIESATQRMARLVDDLLLLARLDAGTRLRHDEVDLCRIAVEATADARVASPSHRFTLDLPDEGILVTGDNDRLHQVVDNLLANARTHTPAGTTVTVSVHPDPVNPGSVVLAVTDDGPGIPEALLPRVRERFVRGDAGRSRERGGSGLGLPIVAAVVAAHGGTLDITSRPGATNVEIRLPRR